MSEWLNERRKGIGGSDAAAICGLSPWRTPLQVWEDKRGLSGPIPDNDAMFWGRTLEPVVRQRYSDKTGRSVLLPTEILHHDKHDFMLANIDGFTQDHRGVEIKTSAYPTGWGEEGTDEIPVGYIFQVQHYMIITGFPVFDVPVLIGGRDFRIYEVPDDKELQEMLIQKEAEFWQMVVNGTPPDPVNFDDVMRLYHRSEAKEITASAEVEVWVEGLRKIRKDLKVLEVNEEEIKFRIMETMKESDTLINLKGDILATWKTGKPTKEYTVKAKDAQRKFLLKGESK
jgi:putative phage-type endonuclease